MRHQSRGPGADLAWAFFLGPEGLLGGVCELGNKKERLENNIFVDADGQIQANVAPRPFRRLLIATFNRSFP